jgi:hypothetical protein
MLAFRRDQAQVRGGQACEFLCGERCAMPDFPPKLSPEQCRAIEAAGRLAPNPSWSDGIHNMIIAELAGDGPWPNAQVQAAIGDVLAGQGIDSPILPEDAPP